MKTHQISQATIFLFPVTLAAACSAMSLWFDQSTGWAFLNLVTISLLFWPAFWMHCGAQWLIHYLRRTPPRHLQIGYGRPILEVGSPTLHLRIHTWPVFSRFVFASSAQDANSAQPSVATIGASLLMICCSALAFSTAEPYVAASLFFSWAPAADAGFALAIAGIVHSWPLMTNIDSSADANAADKLFDQIKPLSARRFFSLEANRNHRHQQNTVAEHICSDSQNDWPLLAMAEQTIGEESLIDGLRSLRRLASCSRDDIVIARCQHLDAICQYLLGKPCNFDLIHKICAKPGLNRAEIHLLNGFGYLYHGNTARAMRELNTLDKNLLPPLYLRLFHCAKAIAFSQRNEFDHCQRHMAIAKNQRTSPQILYLTEKLAVRKKTGA